MTDPSSPQPDEVVVEEGEIDVVAETAPADTDAEVGAGEGAAEADVELAVEDLVTDLERVTAERDESFDARARLQAEFENYRKTVARREDEARFRANERLVSELLPVLDACEGALANGATDVEPINKQLMESLSKLGLEPVGIVGEPFDPNIHEAVMTVEGEGAEDGGPAVVQVLRAGYAWNGRTVRAAMVSVSS